mgnify:CR=1 FL=1
METRIKVTLFTLLIFFVSTTHAYAQLVLWRSVHKSIHLAKDEQWIEEQLAETMLDEFTEDVIMDDTEEAGDTEESEPEQTIPPETITDVEVVDTPGDIWSLVPTE